MLRSSTARTSPREPFRELASSLRAMYLARPGLVAKILAIVAFFSIGVV
jgi:hypothetical protein